MREAALGIEDDAGSWREPVRLGGLVRAGMQLYLRALRLRFQLWRRLRPGTSFSDYYAFRVQRKLAEGGVHPTLGRNRWSPGEFRWYGAGALAFLVSHGLERHHRCIEYGCGSLRVGQHLIRYLDAGRYTGLDVTDRFFLDGLDLLEPELQEQKRPRLALITSAGLAELGRHPADFLVSIEVLQHVEPRELDAFLASLLQLVGPETRAFVSFREWKQPLQTAEKSWSRPARELAERIARIAPGARLEVVRGEWVKRSWDPSRKSILCIQRPAAAAHGPSSGAEDAKGSNPCPSI